MLRLTNEEPMGSKTPLYEDHVARGARVVDFGGWDMPVHYGSQIDEHHAVRQDAGMFDVSHMTVVDVHGGEAESWLRTLLANDVTRLKTPGKALYSCMLNDAGGVIDDLIVYGMGNNEFRLVVNAATREKDLAWMKSRAAAGVTIKERPELSMIAVQGPNARERAAGVLPEAHREAALALNPFEAGEFGDLFIGRTGYTGEDGWEIIIPASGVVAFWDRLADSGIRPCGLGSRDTLRLEAGMNLYGADMDENVTPLESGLAWTVAWDPEDRAFAGRGALEAQRGEGVARKLVGLVLEDRGVLRSHQKVIVEGHEDGETTSGSFSPTLGKSIAFARVPAAIGSECLVEIRGKRLAARVVRPPFVRNGKARV